METAKGVVFTEQRRQSERCLLRVNFMSSEAWPTPGFVGRTYRHTWRTYIHTKLDVCMLCPLSYVSFLKERIKLYKECCREHSVLCSLQWPVGGVRLPLSQLFSGHPVKKLFIQGTLNVIDSSTLHLCHITLRECVNLYPWDTLCVTGKTWERIRFHLGHVEKNFYTWPLTL